ncbi:MAG: DUF4403 family protein [Beijerinckiaceae bacterium]|nr:MAG: DUF4403 family protein [Beijerinckiaceae bacterium]
MAFRQTGYRLPDPIWRPIAALFFCATFAAPAVAADKPPLAPDPPAPLATPSRISATVEFALPALAAALEHDIPRRLATFNERIVCLHKRVFGIDVKAHCDVAGYVERSGHVTLYGKGDRILGSMPVYGKATGRGGDKITSHIHGATQARMMIEGQARPALQRDWSLKLNFSDNFHWSQPPYLHVLGHEISLARFAEPKIRAELAHVKERANAAAQKLDLHKKAATAWRQAFVPIKLADNPQVWLQMKPRSAAFAGIRADSKTLTGTLEISGSAETFVGHAPPAVTPAPLAPLAANVAAPGKFDIVLPVHIGYDFLRRKIMELVATLPKGAMTIRDVTVYPSAGKLVVGARIAKSSEADPKAGEWLYLSATPQIDADKQTLRIPDLAIVGSDSPKNTADDDLVAQLRQRIVISYGEESSKLIDAANQRLTRPLGNGFRIEGHLASARPEKIRLLSDGVSIALHASGTLKILYGL